MEEQLLPFIDTVLKEKNLTGMTREVFAQLRQDMAHELRLQIDRAIIDELSDEQAEHFSVLMDQSGTTNETLQQFMANSGVDTAQVVARTMAKFREFYLGVQSQG